MHEEKNLQMRNIHNPVDDVEFNEPTLAKIFRLDVISQFFSLNSVAYGKDYPKRGSQKFFMRHEESLVKTTAFHRVCNTH